MPGKPYLLETAFRAVIPEGLQPFPCYGGRGRGEASGGENGIDRGLHQSGKLTQEMQRLMERERQNLMWNNKLLENRIAVAEQLGEMAQLMKVLSRDLFDIVQTDPVFREEFAKRLKKKHILLRNVWMLQQPDGKIQYFCELRAKGQACISASEAGAVLTKMCGSRMTPKVEGKTRSQGSSQLSVLWRK